MIEKKPAESRTLPSAETAFDLAEGDTSVWPNLVRDVLVRAMIIGAGARVAGAHFREAAKYGFAGSFAVELCVMGYAVTKTRLKGFFK